MNASFFWLHFCLPKQAWLAETALESSFPSFASYPSEAGNIPAGLEFVVETKRTWSGSWRFLLNNVCFFLIDLDGKLRIQDLRFHVVCECEFIANCNISSRSMSRLNDSKK